MDFQPGQWVVDTSDFGRVAKVKDVYIGEPCLDLVLYARDGERLGRVSPPEGGPRNFEPACDAEHWRPIRKPAFPLPRYGSLREFVKLLDA